MLNCRYVIFASFRYEGAESVAVARRIYVSKCCTVTFGCIPLDMFVFAFRINYDQFFEFAYQ